MIKTKSLVQFTLAITTISVLFACQSDANTKVEEKQNEKRTIDIQKLPEDMKKVLKVDSTSRQKRKERRLKRRTIQDSLTQVN